MHILEDNIRSIWFQVNRPHPTDSSPSRPAVAPHQFSPGQATPHLGQFPPRSFALLDDCPPRPLPPLPFPLSVDPLSPPPLPPPEKKKKKKKKKKKNGF